MNFAADQTGIKSIPENSITKSASVTAVPIPPLYKHFLAHLRQLDSEADQIEKDGKGGTLYKSYYQRRLGFSDTQFNYVREMAYKTSQVDAIDQKARKIVVEYRRELTRGPVSSNGRLPPVPEELHDLKLQRDQLISSQIARLKQELGRAASDTLDTLIRSSFSAQASVSPAVAPNQQRLKPRSSFPPLESTQHE